MKCYRAICSKGKACVILGECIVGHPAILGNPEAKNLMKQKQSLTATIRIFISAVKGKPMPNNAISKHQAIQKGKAEAAIKRAESLKRKQELKEEREIVRLKNIEREREIIMKAQAQQLKRMGFGWGEGEEPNFHY